MTSTDASRADASRTDPRTDASRSDASRSDASRTDASRTDRRTLTNPGTLHDPAPFGYSHAASASGELVFIAGQYASDAAGAPVPGDFADQVDRSLANLRHALAGVGLGFEHVVRLGSYVVDHDLAKLEVLGKALHAAFGERLPAQTLSGVAALALPGMLFEIDAVAVRP